MAPQGQRGAPLPRPDDAVEAQYRDGRRRMAKPLDRQEFQKLARVHHPRNMGIVPPPDQKRRRREVPLTPTLSPLAGRGRARSNVSDILRPARHALAAASPLPVSNGERVASVASRVRGIYSTSASPPRRTASAAAVKRPSASCKTRPAATRAGAATSFRACTRTRL